MPASRALPPGYADQLIERASSTPSSPRDGIDDQRRIFLVNARWGSRLGDGDVVDALIHDGLWSTFTGQHMAESSDEVYAALEISRQDQDRWSARSHQRAVDAGHRPLRRGDRRRRGRNLEAIHTRRRPGRRDLRPQKPLNPSPNLRCRSTLLHHHGRERLTASNGAAALVAMSAARAEALDIQRSRRSSPRHVRRTLRVPTHRPAIALQKATLSRPALTSRTSD